MTVLDPGGPWLLLALCVLVGGSAALHTATGFGFAVLGVPVAAALLDSPAAAVSTVTVVGSAVDLSVFFVRRRPPQPRWGEVAVLGLSSLPGLALGALVLVVVPEPLLFALISAAVTVAVVLRLVTGRGDRSVLPASRAGGVAAGLLSGALATSTALGGPPAVYYLTSRRYPPATVRDTLVALNLVRLPLAVVALATGDVLVLPSDLGWLFTAALLGYVVGSRVFLRLDARRFEVVVLALLVVGAVVAAVSAVV